MSNWHRILKHRYYKNSEASCCRACHCCKKCRQKGTLSRHILPACRSCMHGSRNRPYTESWPWARSRTMPAQRRSHWHRISCEGCARTIARKASSSQSGARLRLRCSLIRRLQFPGGGRDLLLGLLLVPTARAATVVVAQHSPLSAPSHPPVHRVWPWELFGQDFDQGLAFHSSRATSQLEKLDIAR